MIINQSRVAPKALVSPTRMAEVLLLVPTKTRENLEVFREGHFGIHTCNELCSERNTGLRGNMRQTSVIEVYNNVREAANHHITLLKVGRNVWSMAKHSCA